MVEITDEQIDSQYKEYLKVRRNGKFFSLDIVAHLEYFYNTLNMASHLENPFTEPKRYPALLYKDENNSPDTLLEMHRKIIFPGSEKSSGKDSLLSGPSPAKYSWYPNPMLDSPVLSSPLLASPVRSAKQ